MVGHEFFSFSCSRVMLKFLVALSFWGYIVGFHFSFYNCSLVF